MTDGRDPETGLPWASFRVLSFSPFNPSTLRQAQGERVGFGCWLERNRYGRIIYERRFCATLCVPYFPPVAVQSKRACLSASESFASGCMMM